MGKPHKHAELIKAWADGAEIECRWANNFDENVWSDWVVLETFDWYESPFYEYRIKPEPKPDVVIPFFVNTAGSVRYPTDANLKLTFDGETGELKSAEVLK